jgi:uncharacterized membrane protein YqjE
MAEPEPQAGGLVESVRRILDSALAVMRARLRIFSLELQEEKIRLLELLVWLGIALVFGITGLVTLTVAVAVLLWQKAGVGGLVFLGIIYAGACLSACYQLRKRFRERPPPFGDTLAEFNRDREWLEKKN